MESKETTPTPASTVVSEAAFELTATAYHEAGHAVMAVTVGRPVQKVTISKKHLQSGGMRLGACKMKKGRTKASKDWLEDEVLILFAGMVGEAQFTGKYCPRGAQQDLLSIRRQLDGRAKSQRDLEKLERRMLDKTEHLLSDPAAVNAIRLIAEELIEKETVSGRAVQHFINQSSQQFS